MTEPPWYRRLPLVTASGRIAVRAGYGPRIGCRGGAGSPPGGTAEAADPVAASTPLQNSSSNTVWIGWRLRDASMLVPPWGRKRPGCPCLGPDRGAYGALPGPSVMHVTSAGWIDRDRITPVPRIARRSAGSSRVGPAPRARATRRSPLPRRGTGGRDAGSW